MKITLDKKLELINGIPFFNGFDEIDKMVLAELAFFQKFESKEMLFEQNSVNLNLYFIINGSVNVIIDGHLVITLSGGGHLFGEVSFVHHSPANATVVANSKVVVMIFDTTKINQMVEPVHYKLRMNIYRSCAEILARKLIYTNAIAASYKHNHEKVGDFHLLD